MVTVRPFNTFGPRQSARAVIPTIITQCLAGETVRLGSLTPDARPELRRQHRRRLPQGGAGAGRAIGKTINLGSGREISVGDLAKLIAELDRADRSRSNATTSALRPADSEVERLLADNRLAKRRARLGARRSLWRTGSRRTIEWMRENI